MDGFRIISKKRLIIMSVIVFALTVCAFLVNPGFWRISPFAGDYTFDEAENAYVDAQGYIYVIDSSKMNIVKGTPDGRLLYSIPGGKSEGSGFYVADDITVTTGGRVFVHSVRYHGASLYISEESILEYSSSGKYTGEIFKVTYDEEGFRPRQLGLIRGMGFIGGVLRFAYCGENELLFYAMEDGGNEPSVLSSYPLENAYQRVNDICFTDDSRVFYTDKTGIICEINSREPVYAGGDLGESYVLESIPYRLSYADALYFTDLGMWNIRRLSLSDGTITSVTGLPDGAPLPPIDEREFLYNISANGGLLVTVGDAVTVVDLHTGQAQDFEGFRYPPAAVILNIASWLLCLCSAVLLLYIVFILLKRLISPSTSTNVKVAAAAIAGIAVVSAMISLLVLTRSNERISETVAETIKTINALASAEIDADALGRINSNRDFAGEEYNTVKQHLDRVLSEAESIGVEIYYLLYKNHGDIPIGVMDSEYLVSPVFPSIIVPEFYAQAAIEGQMAYDHIRDISGQWALAMNPVRDSFGNIAGVLEIGIDMYAYEQYMRAQTRDVILSIASLTLIIVLVVMECAAFAPAISKRAKMAEQISFDHDIHTESFPETARLLTFLLFTVNCFQDCFVSYLAMNSYDGTLLSHAIGGSLPVVAEAFAVALFAAIGGVVNPKVGGRRLCLTGTLITAAGFVIAGLVPGYMPLLFGKILVGAGLGLCIVSVSAGAAALPGEGISKAFSGITFGTISGIQVGLVAGSLVVEFIGYQNIFLLSAGVSGVCAVVTLMLFYPPRQARTAAVKKKAAHRFSFLFTTRAGVFLLFMLVPAYVGACVIDYYMPIFTLSNGLSEANVGQISILYGVFVLFIGPAMTPWITRRLGSLRAIIIAPVILAAGMALFAVFPTVWAMIALVVLYGVSLCFGYAMRGAFYASMPEVIKFGSDEAMGYFGMVENITQMCAPMLIATVMISGPRTGAVVVGAILVGGLAVFMASRLAGGRSEGEKEVAAV